MTVLLFAAGVLQPNAGQAARIDPAGVVCTSIRYGQTVDSAAVTQALAQAGDRFIREGRATPRSSLTNQLQRRSCTLQLTKPTKAKYGLPQLAALTQPSVLIVARLYQCASCNSLHAAPAAGFIITKGGAFVTSCHVFENKDFVTVVAMTGEGRIYPVAEILAANTDSDLAIGRLAGTGFTARPLSRQAPPGARILVNSHPHGHFFSLSEGIVARHFWERSGELNLPLMAITADFAPGSSGAPVLDETGAAVGVVDSIVLRMPGEGEPTAMNPAFIFKHCRPASAVLDLIIAK